jgi:hypothetical protein
MKNEVKEKITVTLRWCFPKRDPLHLKRHLDVFSKRRERREAENAERQRTQSLDSGNETPAVGRKSDRRGSVRN